MILISKNQFLDLCLTILSFLSMMKNVVYCSRPDSVSMRGRDALYDFFVYVPKH